ncbi:Efflux pump azaK [Hyphodiscus hymeniophilus]|uniref:Efflux pump azaK n=1 Tax=Hyphodiscus hymeniophilus TaxID=353542 RepID=A0A9P6VCH8_9HELO|nr:Efflux pump azaK [Hyphodiscus hymeniophilus]
MDITFPASITTSLWHWRTLTRLFNCLADNVRDLSFECCFTSTRLEGGVLDRSGVSMAFSKLPLSSSVPHQFEPQYTGVQLALNDIAPTHATLGPLNGIALALISGIRSFAPALFSSIFATGVRMRILDGLFIWVILVILALTYTVAIRWLPERAEGKVKSEANGGSS